jgi:transposase-like protein
VLEGLKGETSISELCRQKSIVINLYYRWNKNFLETGKKRLAEDTVREATSSEVTDLRSENDQLKQLAAELSLNNRLLKKSDWFGIRHREYMRYKTNQEFTPPLLSKSLQNNNCFG